MTTSDGAERAAGQFVSGNYHAVVGAPMILGRGFSSEPDRRPGASLIAVISHDYWTSRFGRSAGVIALGAARGLSTFLFGLTSHDPATLLGATGFLLVTAMIAGFLPVRHAAAIDPVRALKNE